MPPPALPPILANSGRCAGGGVAGQCQDADGARGRAARGASDRAVPGSYRRCRNPGGAALSGRRGKISDSRRYRHLGLSVAAEAAIDAMAATSERLARNEAWRATQTDAGVAAELRAFGEAVAQRFGAEAVRKMLRAAGRPGVVTAASRPADHRAELDRVGLVMAVLDAGQREAAGMTQREAEAQHLTRRRMLRP